MAGDHNMVMDKKRLEEEIKELENKYIKSRENQIMLELTVKRRELQNIEIEQVQRNLIYLKRECYESSNKNSKMLARATQVKKAKCLIGVIKNKKEERCNKMKEKLLILQRFFEKLHMGNEIDLKETFDCVKWPTKKVLTEKMGFGIKFKKVINQLYSENMAKIIMIPISFYDQELKEIQKLLEVYCTRGKRARISKAVWYESQKKEGWAFRML
ncbi:hypothetical protein EYD10_09971 [Varanus komodoensis]|nr:hypothetical protein EYD10_09971 [Varanus komodoensis]